ncbi:hypothetical protein Tco_0886149 [Tanacetum coccineum]
MLQNPPISNPQTEGELSKKDTGKAAISSKDAEEEETKSDSENEHANLANYMVESSKKKKLKKFDFVTEEVDKEKNELVDLMGIDVVKKEDGTTEVIPNFKSSDLHLAEWREVVQACPNRKEKGWKTIYEQINTRMDYLHHTEEELKINFSKPLEEQHPLDELNDLANKKRKRADDFHDYLRSTKKFKPLV